MHGTILKTASEMTITDAAQFMMRLHPDKPTRNFKYHKLKNDSVYLIYPTTEPSSPEHYTELLFLITTVLYNCHCSALPKHVLSPEKDQNFKSLFYGIKY